MPYWVPVWCRKLQLCTLGQTRFYGIPTQFHCGCVKPVQLYTLVAIGTWAIAPITQCTQLPSLPDNTLAEELCSSWIAFIMSLCRFGTPVQHCVDSPNVCVQLQQSLSQGTLYIQISQSPKAPTYFITDEIPLGIIGQLLQCLSSPCYVLYLHTHRFAQF